MFHATSLHANNGDTANATQDPSIEIFHVADLQTSVTGVIENAGIGLRPKGFLFGVDEVALITEGHLRL